MGFLADDRDRERKSRVKQITQLGLALMVVTMARGGWCQASGPEINDRNAALTLEQQGKNVEAEAAWRAFSRAHPVNPEPYAHLGLLEARQEHYKKAVPLYRKALALNPTMSNLRLNLGLALFKAGELKEAIQILSPLLKSQPPFSPEAQRLTILVGMAHYGLAEYADSVPFLKQAAARDAQNLPLRLALAHSCLWAKQSQCVLDVYREILTLNAESAEADMLAGEAMDEMKDHDGAIRQFRAAVKANPKEPNVHFGLGYLLWTQKRYEEAAREFEAELDNDPNNNQTLAYLADTNLQMNHPETATPLLQQVIRVDPGIELAHLDLGIFYADAGRLDDALQELKAAAKLAPADVNVHWRLGRLYRAMGKNNDAKVEFDKTSNLHKAIDEALVNKMSSNAKRTEVPTPDLPADK